MENIDRIAINTLRFLSVDAIQAANSGHPGMPLGAAPIAYTLWSRHLKHNPLDSDWKDRDRFILSAGHGSMLLYALLHIFGYRVGLQDLKSFRKLHSCTPGHPEYGETDGVEATTGPLGQGIAMAVGMAMAEARLAARFNKPGYQIVDHYTYVLCGDACLMEGVSAEASSFAGTMGLGKLIVLYDKNSMTIEGPIDSTFTEDVSKRYEAYGWHVVTVDDGDHDIESISNAISIAQKTLDKPSLIIVNTTIGYGCPALQGTPQVHGTPLNAEDISNTKKHLGWEYAESFYVPEAVKDEMRNIQGRLAQKENEWERLFNAYAGAYPDLADRYLRSHEPADAGIFDNDELWRFDNSDMATRQSSGLILNRLAPYIPQLFGGSADLNICNMTQISHLSYFSKEDREGGNIHFGVREFAMAAICNGIALHGGFIAFCGTFLVFLDYMKAALRLSAIMKLPVLYILTHDSIGMGEDGITHQPIEQLAGLRATPGVYVFRPADSTECLAAYQIALTKKAPTAIILSRQSCPQVAGGNRGALRGGYIIKDCAGKPDVILIGTGSEVSLCIDAAVRLGEKHIAARVVSLPCIELFEEQDQAYKQSVLPDGITARLIVEAASSLGWHKYAGHGSFITIDRYGLSAPAEELFDAFGFTAQNISERAEGLFKKR